MEEIFIAIMERIAEKMPELSYIDEDYGQLEAGAEEDHYPVTFPCVLVGNAESDWNDLGYGVQKSESLITIRLAIDCYDDTHYTSGTYDKVRERQLKAKELYKALQEFQCTEETSPLVRVKSRDYSLPGNIKVYETGYSFTLHDESAMQEGEGSFPREQGKLDGCQAGFLNLWDGLHLQVLQLPALAPDNGHDPLLGNEKLLAGQHFQGIIKTQALHLRPVIVTAAQGFITEFYQFFVSSFSHKFRYMLQN